MQATQCSVEGCEKPPGTDRKGMCYMHWSRLKRTGSLELRPRQRMKDESCAVSDCDRNAKQHGYCPMHAERWRAHGDPQMVLAVRGDDVRRFWGKVWQRGPEDCWLYYGPINRDGYGRINLRGKDIMAHRFAYEQSHGPVPEGMQIDHVRSRGCRHRNCVNPAHLEPVTPAENTRRAIEWGDR